MNSRSAYVAPTLDRQALVQETLATRQYVVLIVEDSEIDRVTYRRYISKFSAQQITLLEAETAEAGLTLCQERSPDLVLLDYNLPDSDGLELLQSMQQLHPMPPVIVLTGVGDEQVAVDAMKLGARDYLIKGKLTESSLASAIRRVLGQQALQELMSRQERQQQLVTDVSLQISRAESLPDVLNEAVDGVRELLDCDRVIVYQFEPDLSGTVTAESVLPEWKASLGTHIEDTCFKTGGLEKYEQGYICATTDIANANYSECHLDMLRRFGVQADLAVPILVSEPQARGSSKPQKVWGLLFAHQCRAPRVWQEDELTLFRGLVVQLAIAIRQAELVTYLEERNQDLDNFARVASHDLRAPLRAIFNLASWLEEDIADLIPSENQEQLALLQSRVRRMDCFIAGLLNYSRAGRDTQGVVCVSTQGLLDEVIENLSYPSDFQIVTDVSLVPKLTTHKLLLQQVLSNLIGNAVKYHDRPDGRVTITATVEGQKAVFSVADDGPGIDPDYHEAIFDLFQTLSSRDDVESTGIGLSVVKKVVEREGGQISVCSALGEGSTFTFTWPRH